MKTKKMEAGQDKACLELSRLVVLGYLLPQLGNTSLPLGLTTMAFLIISFETFLMKQRAITRLCLLLQPGLQNPGTTQQETLSFDDLSGSPRCEKALEISGVD